MARAPLIAVLLAFSATTPATAKAPKAGPPPAQVTNLLNCRAIADGNARLACFDRESAAVSAAVARQDLVVFDREAVRSTKRKLFGLALPSLNIFGDDSSDEVKQIDSTVVSSGVNRDGGYTLVLADGSTWAQNEGSPYGFPPKRGEKVTVRRAALGSFIIKIGGAPGVKGHRVN